MVKQVESAAHAHAWSLLPWYANQTLSSEEHSQVNAHLADCPHCRAELARYLSLASAVREQPTATGWQASQAKFDRLMVGIEQSASSVPLQQQRPAPRAPTLMERLSGWLRELGDSTPSARWVMAGQGALVVVLTVILAIVGIDRDESKIFQTATTPATQPASAGHLRLVVDENMPERDMRELLNTIHGTIIQGPGKMGIYTIALNDPASLDAALRALRGNSRVKLAEPVSP